MKVSAQAGPPLLAQGSSVPSMGSLETTAPILRPLSSAPVTYSLPTVRRSTLLLKPSREAGSGGTFSPRHWVASRPKAARMVASSSALVMRRKARRPTVWVPLLGQVTWADGGAGVSPGAGGFVPTGGLPPGGVSPVTGGVFALPVEPGSSPTPPVQLAAARPNARVRARRLMTEVLRRAWNRTAPRRGRRP